MSERRPADVACGLLLVATMLFVIAYEWSGSAMASGPAAVTTTLATLLMAGGVGWSRRAYVLIGGAVLAVAAWVMPDWRDATAAALRTASFIAAFFTALMSIRSAASRSASIEACGRFLARQPPGRRYLALTAGGHLFGLVLSYGAISLLGSLASSSAASEPNPEIRAHRTRRMLVAVQRGFVSTLPWSPLAFAVAISTTVVPGAHWEDAVGLCLVSALILIGTGWGLDTIFKPRLSVQPAPQAQGEGGWLRNLSPLLMLLAVLVLCAAAARSVADVRIIAAVMTVVPLIALAWTALESRDGTGDTLHRTLGRAADYATVELPRSRPELVLLVMAGFIGTLGGHLAASVIPASAADLADLPTWLILLALFWFIPLAGQVGMNPILAVSLVAPLLPPPATLGIDPSVMIVAITGGWALSGATSPFTASTLLIGVIGGVSASHVGMRWNGLYAATAGALLSAWVLIVARIW